MLRWNWNIRRRVINYCFFFIIQKNSNKKKYIYYFAISRKCFMVIFLKKKKQNIIILWHHRFSRFNYWFYAKCTAISKKTQIGNLYRERRFDRMSAVISNICCVLLGDVITSIVDRARGKIKKKKKNFAIFLYILFIVYIT